LQIESSEATTCDITYGGSTYTTSIGEDKKVSSPAGSCLPIDTVYGGYWLRVSSASDCYNKEFKVSCKNSFSTNLLFQKSGSKTIHVSSDTDGASAEGETTTSVNSFCFKKGNSCDYEGSLWASFVLSDDHNVDSFKPYLVTAFDDPGNKQFLPEAFLIGIGEESFRNAFLSSQKNDKWWSVSGNKYYDTAVALLPFVGEEPQEKTNAKNWLLDEAQDDEGCWNNGNIVDTSFLLYSIWPKDISSPGGTGGGTICDGAGEYCVYSTDCLTAGGIELSYSCPGSKVCCDKPKIVESCTTQNGIICTSGKTCSGGRTESQISDTLSSGESCCIGGTCRAVSINTPSQCEQNFGECKSSCDSDEKSISDTCTLTTDFCCIKDDDGGRNYTLLWIFGSLIVLVALGIIFRNKLRRLWVRLKSGKGHKGVVRKGPPGFGPSHFPSRPSIRMPLRRSPRRMPHPVHTQGRPLMRRRPPPRKSSKELDDVLKKLKEMGK